MFVDSRSIGVTSEAKCGKWKRIFGERFVLVDCRSV